MTGILDLLVKETGLRQVDLRRIMIRAPEMYRVYEIDKRSGGKREIAQPAREVKYVQRALMEVLLSKLPIHDCATAYRRGRSILDNARPHAGDGPILKMDLKDFFPSIRSRDWQFYCKHNALDLTDDELELSTRLLFHRRKGGRVLTLAIGAPSSPMLSNILMRDFDEAVLRNLENNHVVYTRYADDLTFSAPRTGFLNGVVKSVAVSIREIRYPKLEINTKKTTHVTRKFGRSVTGLTLTNDGRVTIGRENKRKIHAAVHGAKVGKLSSSELQIAAGMLAYVNAVEPAFLTILRARYGDAIVDLVQRSVHHKVRPESHTPPLARLANTVPTANDDGEAGD